MQLPTSRLARATSFSVTLTTFLLLAPAATAAVIDVNQVGTSFSPQDIVINEGDTVTWHWSFGIHTVTEGTDGVVNGNEAFHSPLSSSTPVFSVTFDAAFLAANPRPNDRYDYFCSPHFTLGMVGSVTVCAPAPTTYCTSRPSSIPNCTPAIGYSGVPSLGLGSGFDVVAGPMPGTKPGLFIYTNNGAAGTPASTPYGDLCIASGFFRVAPQTSGGTAGVCDGQMQMDFVAFALAQTQNPNLIAGATVDMQGWYRDPDNPGGANFTDALHFVLCP